MVAEIGIWLVTGLMILTIIVAASLLVRFLADRGPAAGLRKCHGCGGAVFRRCPRCFPLRESDLRTCDGCGGKYLSRCPRCFPNQE